MGRRCSELGSSSCAFQLFFSQGESRARRADHLEDGRDEIRQRLARSGLRCEQYRLPFKHLSKRCQLLRRCTAATEWSSRATNLWDSLSLYFGRCGHSHFDQCLAHFRRDTELTKC